LFRRGDKIKSLQKFTVAQRMAFYKILKKHKARENLKPEIKEGCGRF
jgi:hypothetical protein